MCMLNLLFQIKAGNKYLKSFLKTDWTIKDYPLRFRHFKTAGQHDDNSRLKPFPWSAQIINWWQMHGTGETKEAAFADLKARFQIAKEQKGSLPRPGTGLPIEFASTDQISLHWNIAEDFFNRVLDKNYHDCWISDESSLWDFHHHESNDHLNKKVWECYRVDISDIEDGNLVKIFQRIEDR
jgi:hypothetical protein